MARKKVAVLGAGMMGYAAAYELTHYEPLFEVTVCDWDKEALQRIATLSPLISILEVDFNDTRELGKKLAEHRAVLSALPYYLNPAAAELALEIGAHYVDLGGNTDAVEKVFSLSAKARSLSLSVLPDAGLAPGLVNILTVVAIHRLPGVHTVNIRCGGLPVDPKPPLEYALVFSVEGLINEYREPCRILRDGLILVVPPLTEVEHLSFPPSFPRLEAFHTSGGSSTLPVTFARKLRNLDYKTIRYPGHCEKASFLLELGMMSGEPVVIDGQKIIPSKVLGGVLRRVLPQDAPDVTLLRIVARNDDKAVKIELVDYADAINHLSAMMRTTAFPATCLLREQVAGNLKPGAWRQEEVVDGEKMIKELAKRGIEISISMAECGPDA